MLHVYTIYTTSSPKGGGKREKKKHTLKLAESDACDVPVAGNTQDERLT